MIKKSRQEWHNKEHERKERARSQRHKRHGQVFGPLLKAYQHNPCTATEDALLREVLKLSQDLAFSAFARAWKEYPWCKGLWRPTAELEATEATVRFSKRLSAGGFKTLGEMLSYLSKQHYFERATEARIEQEDNDATPIEAFREKEVRGESGEKELDEERYEIVLSPNPVQFLSDKVLRVLPQLSLKDRQFADALRYSGGNVGAVMEFFSLTTDAFKKRVDRLTERIQKLTLQLA